MHRRSLILILCAVALVSAANAAVRPMVGFLPFHGPSGSYRHAVPYLVYWQFSHIPGISRTDMGPMASCVELDRLTVPKSLADVASYSQLAAATGVDYLVTGEVQRQTRTTLRFRVVVYSSTDPSLRREQTCECAPGDLIVKASAAAKTIAEAVGVKVDSATQFDTDRICPSVLRLLDDSVRLSTGCERDRADMGESNRLANQAVKLCRDSSLVTQWAQSYYVEAPKNLEGYRDLRQRSMRNLSTRGSTRRWSQSGGQNRPASSGWRLAFDRNYPSNQIGPNGRPVLSSAWRNNLSNYRFRMANANSRPARDVKAYRSVLDGLSARYPRSAYIRYSAAIYLARAGEWEHYTAACEKAAAINPDSYRLQMELIRAYIGSFKNDEALQKLKTAARRWPNSTECHFFAASLYRRWKQYDKAAEETLAVQSIDPQADGIHEQLVEDYMRSGKVVEAVREMAESNPSIRHGMITFSVVLSGIFVVVAMGIAVLTHVALRPERRPLQPPTQRRPLRPPT